MLCDTSADADENSNARFCGWFPNDGILLPNSLLLLLLVDDAPKVGVALAPNTGVTCGTEFVTLLPKSIGALLAGAAGFAPNENTDAAASSFLAVKLNALDCGKAGADWKVDFAGDVFMPKDPKVFGASFSAFAAPNTNEFVDGAGAAIVVVVVFVWPKVIELLVDGAEKEKPPDGVTAVLTGSAGSAGFAPKPPKENPPFLLRELPNAGAGCVDVVVVIGAGAAAETAAVVTVGSAENLKPPNSGFLVSSTFFSSVGVVLIGSVLNVIVFVGAGAAAGAAPNVNIPGFSVAFTSSFS